MIDINHEKVALHKGGVKSLGEAALLFMELQNNLKKVRDLNGKSKIQN